MNHFSTHRTRRGLRFFSASLSLLAIAILTVASGNFAPSQTQSSKQKTLPATATVTKQNHPRMTLKEMASQSEVIAVGKVGDLRSEWNSDKSRIYTSITISVDETIKGAGQTTLTIVYPGGEIGAEGELYSETASFRKNEEVLVFANKDKDGNLRVVGGDRGKYTILTEKASGKKLVAAGASLDAFKSEIKNLLKSQEIK